MPVGTRPGRAYVPGPPHCGVSHGGLYWAPLGEAISLSIRLSDCELSTSWAADPL
jgi:hypothetical protein